MHVTRRSFLVAAGAAAAAPVFLGATDKAGSKPPILGTGNYQYEAIHDWGELPRTIQIRQHTRRLRGFARKHLHPSHGQCHKRKPGHDRRV